MINSYKDKYLKYKMKYNKLKGGFTRIGQSIIILGTNDIYNITGQNDEEYFTNGPPINKNLEGTEWRPILAEIYTTVDLYDHDNTIRYTGLIIDDGDIDDVPVWIVDNGERIYKHNENTDRNWRISPQE